MDNLDFHCAPLRQDFQQQQRIVLLLEYLGSCFSGSQMQRNAYTVQQAVDDALTRLNVPYRSGSMKLAGRTDAGVHAKGQVVQFDVAWDALERIPDLRSALNATLPAAISVQDYAITQNFDFHPLLSAQWRWYQYRIYNSPCRSVWMRPDAVWIKQPLNIEQMLRGARLFLGEQNFASFKCPQTKVSNNICRVIYSQVSQEESYLVFDLIANRFLYKMVRNLAGTLIDIGTGSRGLLPEDIPHILDQQDRRSAGQTAKPEGLSLMAVYYPKPWDFFQNDIYVTTLKQRIQESSSYEKNILCKAS